MATPKETGTPFLAGLLKGHRRTHCHRPLGSPGWGKGTRDYGVSRKPTDVVAIALVAIALVVGYRTFCKRA